MTEITKRKHHISPTMRWVDGEGRLTGEGFRLIRDIAVLIEAVNIVDGEISTEMLADLAVQASKLDDGAVVIGKIAAGAIYVHTLFADEVVITAKVKPNAITELTVGLQTATGGPDGLDLVSVDVPISSVNNTGTLLSFTAFMSRPTLDPANNGYWRLVARRNGAQIGASPALFYDDNFAYPIVGSFVDFSPGSNPRYSIAAVPISGPGFFDINGGILNVSLLKR